VMAAPAVLCYYLFRALLQKNGPWSMIASFSCGFLTVLLSALGVALALFLSEENFFEIATLAVAVHVPVSIVEGIVVVFTVSFLKKVYPAMLTETKKRVKAEPS